MDNLLTHIPPKHWKLRINKEQPLHQVVWIRGDYTEGGFVESPSGTRCLPYYQYAGDFYPIPTEKMDTFKTTYNPETFPRVNTEIRNEGRELWMIR